jgi:hypothetical protein
MYKEATGFDCECAECGHSWFSAAIPGRCAKCKSRKWNGVKSGATKPAKMIIERPKPVEVPRAIATEEASNPEPESEKIEVEIQPEKPKKKKLKPCPRCDSVTIEWGTMRRCTECRQNWPLDS